MERFGRFGVGGTSVRDVAADAGVTLATVHHYFGTKQELYEHCLDHCYAELGALRQELGEVVRAELGRGGRGKQRIESLIGAVAVTAYRFGASHRAASRLLLRANVFEPDEHTIARVRASQRSFLDGASAALAPLLDRDPEELRMPLQGLMFLATRMAVAGDEELAIIGGDADSAGAAFECYVADVAVHSLMKPKRTARRKELHP